MADSNLPPVLDACCGSRMMWFDKANPACLFVDSRQEEYERPPDAAYPNGGGKITVRPDLIADFTQLPFPAESFHLVVFDPPHCGRTGDVGSHKRGWQAFSYGWLTGDWREMLRRGFAECFRVLKPNGTLIFKWTETQIALREILSLTSEKPLFGHRSGARARTHWVVFLKS
jgi:SAM-dependent methyltransferase